MGSNIEFSLPTYIEQQLTSREQTHDTKYNNDKCRNMNPLRNPNTISKAC